LRNGQKGTKLIEILKTQNGKHPEKRKRYYSRTVRLGTKIATNKSEKAKAHLKKEEQ